MVTSAILTLALALNGGPDHPRLLFHQDDLNFLKQNLNHPLYQESWSEVRSAADNPKGPNVSGSQTFTDILALYNGPLNDDTKDIINCGIAFGLTGQTKYVNTIRGHMNNIVNRVNVNYKSGLKWWDTIMWDLLSIRMCIGLDLVWDQLTPAEQASYGNWLKALCTSVDVLHRSDTDGNYYAANKAGGNIKSWDNALFGLTGYLTGDSSWIDYAIDDPSNQVLKSGQWISLNAVAQIQNSIVEEWTGVNSQYGAYRVVDWYRAIDKNYGFNESVGYQTYHFQAVELLARAALRHGVDLYRMATRSTGGDGRHHPVQATERMGKFLTLQVNAVDNEWRTLSGSKYIYTSNDWYNSGRSCLKMAGMSDELGDASLDNVRQRLDAIIQGGLKTTGQFDADFHVLQYAWPLTRVEQVQNARPPAGDVKGTLRFSQSAPLADLSLLRFTAPGIGQVSTPVQVDASGAWDALALDPDRYWIVARAAGFKSTLGVVDVQSRSTVTVPPLDLLAGTHDLQPASADYVSRATIPYVTFRHTDLNGLPPFQQMHVYSEVTPGNYVDLLRTSQGVFELVRFDATTLEFRLWMNRLPWASGTADLWWVAIEPGGDVRADHARYRFSD